MPSTVRASSTTRSSVPCAPGAASSRWSPRPVAWCAFRRSSCRRLPPLTSAPGQRWCPTAAYVDLSGGGEALTSSPLDPASAGLALGTAAGVVKRVTTDATSKVARGRPSRSNRVIGSSGPSNSPPMDPGPGLPHCRRAIAALRGPCGASPGRAGGGMAGIKARRQDRVVFFQRSADRRRAGRHVRRVVRRVAGHPGRDLEGDPYAEYPAKGRATGGVRAHRFLRARTRSFWRGPATPQARASSSNGIATSSAPPADGRRRIRLSCTDGRGLDRLAGLCDDICRGRYPIVTAACPCCGRGVNAFGPRDGSPQRRGPAGLGVQPEMEAGHGPQLQRRAAAGVGFSIVAVSVPRRRAVAAPSDFQFRRYRRRGHHVTASGVT